MITTSTVGRNGHGVRVQLGLQELEGSIVGLADNGCQLGDREISRHGDEGAISAVMAKGIRRQSDGSVGGAELGDTM